MKSSDPPTIQRLRLSVHAADGREFVPILRRRLRAAHRLLGNAALRELSVALVDAPTMKQLHGRHLGKDSVTDVLSFELEHDQKGRVIGGEVVVCVPQARRQARTKAAEEVALCAIHGMLHLCGFDDKTPRQFAAMHRTEDELLSKMGIGAVFAPAESIGKSRLRGRGRTRLHAGGTPSPALPRNTGGGGKRRSGAGRGGQER